MTVAVRVGCVAALAALLLAAGGWAGAQSVLVVPEPPVVLSGQDIGFRVEGRRGDARVGGFVVRIDGQWIEALAVGGLARLSSK
jgi:hypothetical protein